MAKPASEDALDMDLACQWKGTLGHVFSGQDSLNLGPAVCMTEVWTLRSEMGFTFPTPQGFPEGSD